MLTQNLKDLALKEIEEIEVCEWHPDENGQGKPTQVHILYKVAGSPVRLLLRLKSARAVDDLVAALLSHRFNVWGGPRR